MDTCDSQGGGERGRVPLVFVDLNVTLYRWIFWPHLVFLFFFPSLQWSSIQRVFPSPSGAKPINLLGTTILLSVSVGCFDSSCVALRFVSHI